MQRVALYCLLAIGVVASRNAEAQTVRSVVVQSTGVYGTVVHSVMGKTNSEIAVHGVWDHSFDSTVNILKLQPASGEDSSDTRYFSCRSFWKFVRPDREAGKRIIVQQSADSVIITVPERRGSYTYRLRKSSS